MQPALVRPTRLAALLLLCVAAGAAKAQVKVGNSVFPRVGDTLSYAFDPNPSAAIAIGLPGGPQTWDFSSLQATHTWTETLQNASAGSGAALFPNATLVYSRQNAPAAISALLPGSNGNQVYLRVTDQKVSLMGYLGGSDASGLGLPAYYSNCVGVQGCNPDFRQDFMTRYADGGLDLLTAPKQFFDFRTDSASIMEVYPGVPLAGLPGPVPDYLRVRASILSSTVVDGFGTLTLPGGASFEVLRESTRTTVQLSLDARVSVLWVPVTDLGAPDFRPARWGTWEQYTTRYFDATSKESLAITFSPIARWPGGGDPLLIDSVQFKHLAPVPELPTAPLLLAGVVLLAWRGSRRSAAVPMRR